MLIQKRFEFSYTSFIKKLKHFFFLVCMCVELNVDYHVCYIYTLEKQVEEFIACKKAKAFANTGSLDSETVNHYEIIISSVSTETVHLLFIGAWEFLMEALSSNKSSLAIFLTYCRM